MPTTSRITRLVLAVAATTLLAACGSTPPEDAYLIPEQSGLYAVRYNTPERIDGDMAFENATWDRRSTIPGVAEFVVFDEGRDMTAIAADTISLRKVAWVRSRYTQAGTVAPVEGSRWGVPTLPSYVIPVTLRTVAGREDVIRVTPSQTLEPGLYSLQYGTNTARIGVDWPSLDPDAYAADHCVDIRETTDGVTWADCAGGATLTTAEASQPQMTTEPPYRISLETPARESLGADEVLVIDGLLTNTAGGSQPPPLLTAQLKDATGSVLIEWDFMPANTSIGAGQTIGFSTRVVNPPAGTTSVYVDLADALRAG